MPSIFLFVRSNANKESNLECERDVADSDDCAHKRIRRENDIGKLRFLSTWCTVRQLNQQEFQRMHHAPGNLMIKFVDFC